MKQSLDRLIITRLEDTDFYSSDSFLNAKSFYFDAGKLFLVANSMIMSIVLIFNDSRMESKLIEWSGFDSGTFILLKMGLALATCIFGCRVYKVPWKEMVICPIISCFIVVVGSWMSLINLAHLLLPGTEQRRSEAFHLHLAVEGIDRSPERLTEIAESKGLDSLDYKFQLAKTDIDKFLLDHKITSQSLVRFIKERYKDDEHEVNYFFIFMLLTLPRHISVEGIKQILTGATQHVLNKEKILDEFRYVKLTNFAFYRAHAFLLNKNEAELKLILTKNYKAEDYTRFIYFCFNQPYLINPEGTSLIELTDNHKKKIQHHGLEKFKFGSADSGFKIKILVTKEDYKQARHEFKNCVLSYFDRRAYDILSVYHQDKPLACVSVKSREIKEIKGPKNNDLPKDIQNQIKSIITESLG